MNMFPWKDSIEKMNAGLLKQSNFSYEKYH